jgi:hypothetical protein
VSFGVPESLEKSVLVTPQQTCLKLLQTDSSLGEVVKDYFSKQRPLKMRT